MSPSPFQHNGVGKIPRKSVITRAKFYLPILILVFAVVLAVAAYPSKSPNSSSLSIGNAVLGTSMAQRPGLTRSGLQCGPNIRQVTWSKYSPMCEPKFTGNNGNATSPGVTKNTITITYRVPASSLSGLTASFFPPQLVGTQAQALQTMQTYIDLFNKEFELYNRHVVLKTFVGKGNELTELQGQGQEQAQQDALTAKSDGAFADVSLLASTQLYDQDLANEHVISIGAIAQPQSWFESYAPYEFSPNGTCDDSATVSATIIGRTMANQNAIFAGEPSFTKQKRKFGLIYPENPSYAGCALELAKIIATRYHSPMVREVAYTINIQQAVPQATNVIAQMKAHGVTSIVCACDPLFPIWLAMAANQQNYSPEWLATNFGDIFGQKVSTSQWSHDISGGLVTQPKLQQEAYQAYKLEDPTGTPSPEFASIYEPLLLL
ncbi:MAG: hypothetical protein HKL80_00370, partial [Acidimicrobiales bacterium]|nr:hypothetical protein [Acidimicrobiales bacterium]